jgi:hypothetical protein
VAFRFESFQVLVKQVIESARRWRTTHGEKKGAQFTMKQAAIGPAWAHLATESGGRLAADFPQQTRHTRSFMTQPEHHAALVVVHPAPAGDFLDRALTAKADVCVVQATNADTG